MDVNQKYIIPYNRSESASHECTASSCACRNTAPWSRPRCTGQTGQTTGESSCSSYRRWVAPDTKIRSRGWERCYGWGFTVFYMKNYCTIQIIAVPCSSRHCQSGCCPESGGFWGQHPPRPSWWHWQPTRSCSRPWAAKSSSSWGLSGSRCEAEKLQCTYSTRNFKKCKFLWKIK